MEQIRNKIKRKYDFVNWKGEKRKKVKIYSMKRKAIKYDCDFSK